MNYKNFCFFLLMNYFCNASNFNMEQIEYMKKISDDYAMCEASILDESKVVEVTQDNYQEEVLNSDRPVLIIAGAGWCMPCKILKPIYTKIAEQYSHLYKFVTIEVRDFISFSNDYKIENIPTLLIFVKGKEIERRSPLMTKDDFIKMILDVYAKIGQKYEF